MAKINNELLKHEMLQYQDLKKDDELSGELEFEEAYLIIKTKHVKI